MAKDRQTLERSVEIEWPTVALIAACYGSWLFLGLFVWPAWPAVALCAMGIVLALQSSLMHEAVHGHPTRKAWINELLVGLPIGLAWPYRRFRTLHLRHHADERLTDPFDDPESYYRALWQHEQFPEAMKLLLKINNSMVGRLVIGPWLATVGFAIGDFRMIRAGDEAVRTAWIHHAIGLALVVPVVVWGFGMPLWLYVLAPVWIGLSILSIRTFAEHQWSESPDGRTIIVERSPLALLFLNNNLHFVHHKSPTVAWYRLPKLFRDRREEWIARNGGYVVPGYLALFRDFAFRAKEPVVHPTLRRVPQAGASFRPRQRSRSVHGGGTAPVPAEPAKE
ncbi:MAG: fatty acid desaturase [Rhizobiaceae bacterium]